ncbi:uncharacterized protein [Drosophila suzukii]|uniref:Uncharacterized protein n=1 Tax=Drosophila suzukii TaxID=28584 RepID=A0ABM4TZ66_DROSZ
MEGKPQNRMQEVSTDEIGRLVQAVALYCGISPTESNTTTGANPQDSGNAGRDPLEDPSAKEHAEWDFVPYMDILAGVPSQRNGTNNNTISDDLSIRTADTTTTSYLAAYAELGGGKKGAR